MPYPHLALDTVSTWRQPSVPHPTAVDAVEVARVPHLVLIRSSLGRPIGFTPGAWSRFREAVKAGEFDDL
ncbi:DUF397 domain-containing protein [Frankia sp. KB5]|uniref:DUF397 domain-containing protein n=1 Tax=Frankia sp. KB5 TaxID=683318 RepID=UPI000A118481|nr:DUF397 domain-containing protein [Frankia sp. KB5]ORT53592.1 hypothetical protein KBI5_06615 [Frankia sp. KB5]